MDIELEDDFNELPVDESIQSALDRHVSELAGRLEEADLQRLPVPPPPTATGRFKRRPRLDPAPDAVGGEIPVERKAWIAKYDPNRVDRDDEIGASDVFHEFPWAEPLEAAEDPWIHSHLMRGAPQALPHMQPGDLVFTMRTGSRDGDPTELNRRTIVGLWVVDSVVTWPEQPTRSKSPIGGNAACLPARRFDFPVPVRETSDVDRAFEAVRALHDSTRRSLIELDPQEALSVARACGLPARVLSASDPLKLLRSLAALDLGPATDVRQRILDGARAVAHRNAVERAAVDLVEADLHRRGYTVLSMENRRGVGYDLLATACGPDGMALRLGVEVKGLSGRDPLAAKLTLNELEAARRDRGQGEWVLATVIRALRDDRKLRWHPSDDVVATWTETKDGRTFTVKRPVRQSTDSS